MATAFELPGLWRQHWRLKIRDKETVEPPHISLLYKTQCWRISLRDGTYLDREPAPELVPRALERHIRMNLDQYAAVWNDTYPRNPVRPKESDDAEG